MYSCHICGNELSPELDFGRQPLANSYLGKGETDRVWYTAIWGWCEDCQLLQLVDVPNVDDVFNVEYPYITDQSKFMMDHFRRTAETLEYSYDLAGKSVLEIGCNSGGMIEHLHRTRVIGVEPAVASQVILVRKNIPFWGALFNQELAESIAKTNRQFDMVYAANTLRSLKDLNDFFKSVKLVLKDSGVFIFEEPYLSNILERNEFDQFYSENVYAFTVNSVRRLAERFGMDLIQVDALPLNHGGSLRYHLARFGRRTKLNGVKDYIKSENDMLPRIRAMYAYAQHIKDEFRQALIKCVKKPVGYGATAKSATILNWAGIGPALLPVIYDTTPTKIGKLTPGMHIPIRDASEFRNDPAELAVLFPYNLAQEIIPRENKIRQRKWLMYAPEVHYD